MLYDASRLSNADDSLFDLKFWLAAQDTERTPGGRGAEDTRRRGDMPTRFVVRGIDRVANARLDLEAEDEGMHEIAT